MCIDVGIFELVPGVAVLYFVDEIIEWGKDELDAILVDVLDEIADSYHEPEDELINIIA